MATNKFLTIVAGIPRLVAAIASSAGVSDANKIIASNTQGKIDPTFIPTNIEVKGYRPTVSVTGNKTISTTDLGTTQIVTAAAAITIAPDSSLGSLNYSAEIEVIVHTTGAVTLVQGSGVTIKYRNAAGTATTGTVTAAGDASALFLKRVSANTWICVGATT